MPFHCTCLARDTPWGSPQEVDQWGRVGEGAELDRKFDPWTGKNGGMYEKSKTPWAKEGEASFLEKCQDRRGVERWCWLDPGAPVETRPLLPPARHCAAYGTRLGQSMAYVAIHLGEILSLLTYRTDACFLPHTFSNVVFNGLFVFNLVGLGCFLYVPAISEILQLAPLTALLFGIAACFPFCLMLLNELAKVFYRRQLRQQHARQGAEALRRAKGGDAADPIGKNA